MRQLDCCFHGYFKKDQLLNLQEGKKKKKTSQISRKIQNKNSN